TGEICISGPSLAHGYLNRPALTATHFRPNPGLEPGENPGGATGESSANPDETVMASKTGDTPASPTGGRLYHTGDLATYTPDGLLLFQRRTDTQHKIRGYRIELTEIENVLTTHPRITHAAVTTHPDPTGTLRLTAYLTLKNTHTNTDADADGGGGGETLTATDIRTHLAPHLPDYMIPATYLPLTHLPTTHNGKTDRNALPPPHTLTPLPTSDVVEQRTSPLHDTLVGIWKEVLGVPAVVSADNFFTLGGHSLAAVRLLFLVRDRLKVELTLRDLYDTEDFAAFVTWVGERLPAGTELTAPDTAASPDEH
ncbi:phosphopantetheine-binding protein, partial [Streptosporangium sp. NPDC049376]|uniref:non-ribosomal peptide synthetase n=1 Tax=Streptosporangium sp. NPDC049376 TaxID=3366192 RepID=UPI003789CD03